MARPTRRRYHKKATAKRGEDAVCDIDLSVSQRSEQSTSAPSSTRWTTTRPEQTASLSKPTTRPATSALRGPNGAHDTVNSRKLSRVSNKERSLRTKPLIRPPTAQTSRNFATICDLPYEILEQILKLVLQHDVPIYANHRWNLIRLSEGNSILDKLNILRVRNVCDRRNMRYWDGFYEVGLPLYYSLNTWVLHLEVFKDLPELMTHWGGPEFADGDCDEGEMDMIPPATTRQSVKSLILHAVGLRNFDDSVRCIQAFPNLEKVVFDLRWSTGAYKSGRQWVEIEACEGVKQLLRDKGILGEGRNLKHVSLGDEKVEYIESKIQILEENLARAR